MHGICLHDLIDLNHQGLGQTRTLNLAMLAFCTTPCMQALTTPPASAQDMQRDSSSPKLRLLPTVAGIALHLLCLDDTASAAIQGWQPGMACATGMAVKGK